MLTNGDRLLSTVLWRVKYRQQLNIAALGACKYRPCGHSTSFEDKFSTISQTNAKLMLVNRISCLLCDKHFTESELNKHELQHRAISLVCANGERVYLERGSLEVLTCRSRVMPPVLRWRGAFQPSVLMERAVLAGVLRRVVTLMINRNRACILPWNRCVRVRGWLGGISIHLTEASLRHGWHKIRQRRLIIIIWWLHSARSVGKI